MKPTILMIAASLLLGSAVSYAQPPQEVIVTDLIKLQPGEPKTYEFAESVSRIGTGVEGVILITPHTDRMFTFQGVAPGQAMVVAHDANGEIIHRMLIEVAYEGTLIKVYHPTYDDGKYYDSFQCTSHSGCGRANPDLPKQTKEKKIEVVKRTPDGVTITSTKERQ